MLSQIRFAILDNAKSPPPLVSLRRLPRFGVSSTQHLLSNPTQSDPARRSKCNDIIRVVEFTRRQSRHVGTTGPILRTRRTEALSRGAEVMRHDHGWRNKPLPCFAIMQGCQCQQARLGTSGRSDRESSWVRVKGCDAVRSREEWATLIFSSSPHVGFRDCHKRQRSTILFSRINVVLTSVQVPASSSSSLP